MSLFPLFSICSSGWTGVDLALFDAADVSVEAAPAAGGHAMRAVRFPPFPERVLATQARAGALFHLEIPCRCYCVPATRC